MLDEARRLERDGEYVEFLAAGADAAGAYRCSACGYGVTVHLALPQCPMCSGKTWEAAALSPIRPREPLQ
jgi:rubrerythrin